MSVYIISSDYELANKCPFGVTFVSPADLKHPATHLKFVAANSTVIIDADSDLDIKRLPIATEAVNVVIMVPANLYTDKLVTILTHVFPQHSPLIRKSYMYGEEAFTDAVNSLNATYLWDNTVKTYLGGMEV